MHVWKLDDLPHLSAALNMPLAVCDLRSGGQEERKMSSSFIIERTFEADTSARERSKARLERRPRRCHYMQILYVFVGRVQTATVDHSRVIRTLISRH